MKSGSRISYTRTLEEQTLVYLSVTPPNLSMMLVWNNLADPYLSVFSHFARFSQTLTLKKVLVRNHSLRRENITGVLNQFGGKVTKFFDLFEHYADKSVP